MAQAPRPDSKATKILYSILGKPMNMDQGDSFKKKKPRVVENENVFNSYSRF